LVLGEIVLSPHLAHVRWVAMPQSTLIRSVVAAQVAHCSHVAMLS